MDASLPEDLNLQERSRLAQPPDWFMPIGSLAHQFGMMCKPSTPNPENLTASLVAVPVKICPPAETRRDLTASDQDCGGSNSESLMNADQNLLAGRMLKEHLAEELGKLLLASEWSDIKLRVQSSYRQRNSERRISESEFLSLPTATTYPSGSGTASPAGRNSLETRLRSPAAIPTPRANDGMQGYNSGKTGGMNLTGYLKFPTPQNANSATLQGQIKLAAIVPGQSANPQI